MTKGNITQVRTSLKVGFLYGLLTTLLTLLLSQQAVAQNGPSTNPMERQIEFDIAAQTSLEDALIEWGSKCGISVMINTHAVTGRATAGVHGKLPARQALSRLLDGSGLTYKEHGNRVIVIPIKELNHVSLRSSDEDVPEPSTTTSAGITGGGDDSYETNERKLEQVVVTAEKREERLQDVPIPLAVIAPENLTQNNNLRLQDYYQTVPGLNVTSTDSLGGADITIRGISAGRGGNPSVSITVDDVPFGSSTSIGGGNVVPDIDPGDLKSIEVLRGPQGALYGVASVGGLIKYSTIDPSTTSGFTARVSAGTSGVENGAEPGYEFRASTNIPISGTFAMRASAFTRETPGWIDDPIRNLDGVNKGEARGGRLSALWKPSEDFSLKLSATVQNLRQFGASETNVGVPGLPTGDLDQYYLPNTWRFDKTYEVYSAIAKARLGSADFESITGYTRNTYKGTTDDTFAYGSILGPPTNLVISQGLNPAAVLAYGTVHETASNLSEEMRLTMLVTQKLDLMIGLFFADQKANIVEGDFPATPDGSVINVDEFGYSGPSAYKEYAAFTNLTVHFTDRFDVQFGGRESHTTQHAYNVSTGPIVQYYYGMPSLPAPYTPASDNSATYLFTPRFKLSHGQMVYFRFASGYRAGGPNVAPGAPTEYGPDKTYDFDLGFKGDMLDHLLSIDASLYYIDWKNIQLNAGTSGLGYPYIGNAGSAKSEGVELSVTLRPTDHLKLDAWVDFDNAVLTANFSAATLATGTIGFAGDRLPDSSRISGNFALTQDVPLTQDIMGYWGATMSYVGNRYSNFGATFNGTQTYAVMGGYARADFHAGVRVSSWTINLYGNNVLDRRAMLEPSFYPNTVAYIQPRTVGIDVEKTF